MAGQLSDIQLVMAQGLLPSQSHLFRKHRILLLPTAECVATDAEHGSSTLHPYAMAQQMQHLDSDGIRQFRRRPTAPVLDQGARLTRPDFALALGVRRHTEIPTHPPHSRGARSSTSTNGTRPTTQSLMTRKSM